MAGGCRRHSATHGEDESETLCRCQAAAHHSVTQHPGHEGPHFYHAAPCADNPQSACTKQWNSQTELDVAATFLLLKWKWFEMYYCFPCPVPIVLARTTTGYWPRSHLTPHVTHHVPLNPQPAVNSKEDTTFIGLGLHHVSKSSFIHTAWWLYCQALSPL